MIRFLILAWIVLLPDVSPRDRHIRPESCGLVKTLVPTQMEILGVSFSARHLAAGGSDSRIVLYDIASWKVAREWKQEGGVTAVLFSPDARKLLSVGMDQSLHLWDVERGEELLTLGAPNETLRALWSRDGSKVVTCGNNQTLRVWNVETGREEKSVALPQTAYSLAFSADGRFLAAGCMDQQVRLFDTESWEMKRSFEVSSSVYAVCFSSDGRVLFAGGEAGDDNPSADIVAFEVEGGREVGRMSGHRSSISSLVLTRNGRFLVSSSEVIRIWDARTFQSRAILQHHHLPVNSLAVTPDGRFLASGSHDAQVKIWGDVPGGMSRVRRKGYLGIQMSPADEAGGIRILSVMPGTPAEKEGLRVGDQLTKVAGIEVATFREAMAQIGIRFEGDEIELGVIRNGQPLTVRVTLAPRPEYDEQK